MLGKEICFDTEKHQKMKDSENGLCLSSGWQTAFVLCSMFLMDKKTKQAEDGFLGWTTKWFSQTREGENILWIAFLDNIWWTVVCFKRLATEEVFGEGEIEKAVENGLNTFLPPTSRQIRNLNLNFRLALKKARETWENERLYLLGLAI